MIDRSLRNIGIMAHIDAGKTPPPPRGFSFTPEKSHRIGEVDNGEATMDWMEQEQNRGITITSAATTCFWRDHRINIIDTPGTCGFYRRGGTVPAGFRRCGSYFFAPSAAVEPQSETVWRQANTYQVPRIAYINKMDRVGANFFHRRGGVGKKAGSQPPWYSTSPIGAESEFEGVVDILRMREVHWGGGPQGGRTVLQSYSAGT